MLEMIHDLLETINDLFKASRQAPKNDCIYCIWLGKDLEISEH